jgi:hypothetical protein
MFQKWDETVPLCDKVLEIEPNNVKALFRRAQVSMLKTFILLRP